MKKYFTLFLIFITISSFAQDYFEFYGRIKPNSSYVTLVQNVMNMNFSIEDIEDEKYQTKSESEIELITKAHALDNAGNIPFETYYSKINSKTSINGEAIPTVNKELEALYQVKIKGIDKATGKEFTNYEGPEETKKMFNLFFDSFKNLLVYPSEVFRINDTHHVENSISVPMPDGSTFTFVSKTLFTLKKIENGKAYFNVEMTADKNTIELKLFNITITKYEVKGDMWVDVMDNNISEMNLRGPNEMLLEGNGLKIIMDTDYHYIIKSQKM